MFDTVEEVQKRLLDQNYIAGKKIATGDGAAGFVVSVLNSYYVAMKFTKLWELCSHSTSTPPAVGAGDRTRSS